MDRASHKGSFACGLVFLGKGEGGVILVVILASRGSCLPVALLHRSHCTCMVCTTTFKAVHPASFPCKLLWAGACQSSTSKLGLGRRLGCVRHWRSELLFSSLLFLALCFLLRRRGEEVWCHFGSHAAPQTGSSCLMGRTPVVLLSLAACACGVHVASQQHASMSERTTSTRCCPMGPVFCPSEREGAVGD